MCSLNLLIAAIKLQGYYNVIKCYYNVITCNKSIDVEILKKKIVVCLDGILAHEKTITHKCSRKICSLF